MGGAVDVRHLAERIRAIERRHGAGSVADDGFIDRSAQEVTPTGWPEIDAALRGGLPAGLHEWFGTPPLCILVHLAWQALEHDLAGRWTIWVGRCCHPYPRVLVRGRGADRRLLEHSLFVSPRDAATRLWAMDLALRSPAVGIVIGDGGGFDMAATRRIQMLARSNSKWVLAARPFEQRDELSAAQTRWRASAIGRKRGQEPSPISASRTGSSLGARSVDVVEGKAPDPFSTRSPVSITWNVELLRCKGLRPVGDHSAWLLEWNRAEGVVDLSAPLADLASEPAKKASRFA